MGNAGVCLWEFILGIGAIGSVADSDSEGLRFEPLIPSQKKHYGKIRILDFLNNPIEGRIRSVHPLKSSAMRTADFWCTNTLLGVCG